MPAALVSWGMFFAAGGDNAAFSKVSIANAFGAVAALIMMILAAASADLPDFWGISLWVAIMAAVLVLLAALGDWYLIPATFGAFASVVFWWLATGLDGRAEKGGGVGNRLKALAAPETAGAGAFGGARRRSPRAGYALCASSASSSAVCRGTTMTGTGE